LLSALLSEKGAPRVILDILCLDLPLVKGVTGEYSLIEIERNIKTRLLAILDIYQSYFPKLCLEIIPIPPIETLKPYIGMIAAKDAPVLASAVSSGADYLVTGDKNFLTSLKIMRLSPLKWSVHRSSFI